MRIIKRKQQEDKQNKLNKKAIIEGFLFLLFVFSLWFYRDSLRDILGGIRRVTWRELSISILLSSLGYLFEGLTIWGMMGGVIPQTAVGDGVFIAFVCEFYRLTTLGNGSGVAEIHYLHQKNVEPGSAAVLTMIQYIIKRIAILMFGILGFFFLCRQSGARDFCREYAVFMGVGSIITVVIIFLFLCVVLSAKVTKAVLWIAGWLSLKFPAGKKSFDKWQEQVRLLNKSGRSVIEQKKRMLGILITQMIKLLVFYVIPGYLLFEKISLGIAECVWLMAVSFMLSGVIPAPSGAGALEFVFFLFFSEFGDSGAVVSALLVYRFATWIYPAVVGGGLLFLRRLSEKEAD